MIRIMRRKPDRLAPLERDICVAAFHLSSRGIDEFHDYQLAKILKDGESHRLLTAYATLYRALGRLEMGLLASRWEDSAAGSAAAVEAQQPASASARARVGRRIVPA